MFDDAVQFHYKAVRIDRMLRREHAVQRCRESVLGKPLEQAAVNARSLCNQLYAIAFENVRMGDHFLHIAHLRDGANIVRIFVWRVGEADVRNVFVHQGIPV